MSDAREAQRPIIDWILLFFLLRRVTFTLCLCAFSLIEVQKRGGEIELQIELHPKVMWALKRCTTAVETAAVGPCSYLIAAQKQIFNSLMLF